jgi:ABC-type phosphate transport system permease subunit
MVSYHGTRSSNGVKPLIYGTLWVSFGAILALPIAGSSHLSEIAKKRTRNLLRPLIELWLEFHLLFMVF